MSRYLIWWTGQAECERLGAPGDATAWLRELPDYVRKEYASRYGRAGRGRLWLPEGIDITSLVWDDTKPVASIIETMAGIVFRDADLPVLAQMPGLVTDLALNVVAAPAAGDGGDSSRSG